MEWDLAVCAPTRWSTFVFFHQCGNTNYGMIEIGSPLLFLRVFFFSLCQGHRIVYGYYYYYLWAEKQGWITGQIE